jgi:phosphohistidine phosphatase
MKILLLRHGIAVEPGAAGIMQDSERALNPEGRSKTRRIARALVRLGVRPDAILTSPYVRARQTAEIVADELGLKKRLLLCEPLASGGDAKRLIAAINKQFPKAESLLLVGHEPDLSLLAALLLTGRPGGAQIELKKSGLCLLTTEALRPGRCATLEWLAPPKLLLGKAG